MTAHEHALPEEQGRAERTPHEAPAGLRSFFDALEPEGIGWMLLRPVAGVGSS